MILPRYTLTVAPQGQPGRGLKVLIVGPRHCGKTSLADRFGKAWDMRVHDNLSYLSGFGTMVAVMCESDTGDVFVAQSLLTIPPRLHTKFDVICVHPSKARECLSVLQGPGAQLTVADPQLQLPVYDHFLVADFKGPLCYINPDTPPAARLTP